jgi:hypothetical protein
MKGGKKGKDGKGKGKKDFKRNDWQKEKGKSTGNGRKTQRARMSHATTVARQAT